MKLEHRRIIALLLLFVTITGLVMSFGEGILCAGELPVAHGKGSSQAAHYEGQIFDANCPSSPTPAHSAGDHFCLGSCNGPCHAPLGSTAVTFVCTPSLVPLFHVENTRYIPEVYLSLFVPPDSSAV